MSRTWSVGLLSGIIASGALAEEDVAEESTAPPVEAVALVPVSAAAPTETNGDYRVGQPGPWGRIETYSTYLEAPRSIMDQVPLPSSETEWRFVGQSMNEVVSMLSKLDLDQEAQRDLFQSSRWYVSTEATRVTPGPAVVKALSPLDRAWLYGILGRWEENPYCRTPVVIEGGDAEAWFRDSGLSPQVVERIEGLLYPSGRSLAFSDIPYILGLVETAQEEAAVMRVLSRTRALVARVVLEEGTDREQLARYWSANGRNWTGTPLLQSIGAVPPGTRIDVIHLLPSLPRRQLNRYPNISDALNGRLPDAFWTALNFFNIAPREDFGDAATATEELMKRYDPVSPPFRFGDILLLTEERTGKSFHACVYIADDVIYTKNGPGALRPWILMRKEDLISRIRITGDVTLSGYRYRQGS